MSLTLCLPWSGRGAATTLAKPFIPVDMFVFGERGDLKHDGFV